MFEETIQTNILSVSQLNQQVHFLLEKSFPNILVEGEISNLSRPASGHWYFSLKDEGAQIRCAMFRLRNMRVNFDIESGIKVIAKAKVTLYEPRGDYQLIVESLEEAGLGALQKQFEALKKKLEKAGLFDETHKQALPYIPQKVGVITSATGAALRDILRVLNRRAPALSIIIYPTLVQGERASAQIAAAIETANARNECDVLILARGGGSLEDLWPFNEEVVAHAVYDSKIPIVCGVGHEVDFSIADFVADVRAATPSAAAEIVAPHYEELCSTLAYYHEQLHKFMTQKLQYLSQQLDWLAHRLQQAHPARAIEQHHALLKQFKQRLFFCIKSQLKDEQQRLSALAKHLHALSPLAVLDRGYAVIRQAADNKLIREKKDVKANDKIIAKLSDFELLCTVDKVNNH